MRISIIIPAYNEGQQLIQLLESIQVWRQAGHEIILVDGAKSNESSAHLNQYIDKNIKSATGRALQMNTGAKQASNEVLFFLHADSKLAENSLGAILSGLEKNSNVWGRFDIHLSGGHWMMRVIEKMMNLRSRVTGIATGDQGIFTYKEDFIKIGGYANIELMEDIDISKRLKKVSPPLCLNNQITTSSRKWEQQGIIKTMLLMWMLRFAYFIGVSPRRLASIYYSS